MARDLVSDGYRQGANVRVYAGHTLGRFQIACHDRPVVFSYFSER